MSFSLSLNKFDTLIFDGINLDTVLFDGTVVWEGLPNILSLIDFTYKVKANVAYVTGWKGTYNGVSSTVCYIPEDNKYPIDITKFNFRKYVNITNVYISNNTVISSDFNSRFYNMPNLKYSTIPYEKITNMAYTYQNCSNLTGSPVCGENVTSMYMTYYNCYNLTGSPVCGENVTKMESSYS